MQLLYNLKLKLLQFKKRIKRCIKKFMYEHLYVGDSYLQLYVVFKTFKHMLIFDIILFSVLLVILLIPVFIVNIIF
jgi:hypothetical protein